MYSDNTMLTKIGEMTANYASKTKGGSDATRATIECIVGATAPLLASLFSGGTLQERLLFALVLTRACTTISNQGKESYAVSIDVSPETLREAFEAFTHICDRDIRPYLPKEMLEFASKADQHPTH